MCLHIAGVCALLQLNLNQYASQCNDKPDLNRTKDCFKCLDNRLIISSKQLCDGKFDCYDLSDECLCKINSYNKWCNSAFPTYDSSTLECCDSTKHCEIDRKKLSNIRCQTKQNEILATMCKCIAKCRSYDVPLVTCNDFCYVLYLLNDRHWDGVLIINQSICPETFVHLNCSKRFNCSSGSKVSIGIVKECDRIKDCDQSEYEEITRNKKSISHPIRK